MPSARRGEAPARAVARPPPDLAGGRGSPGAFVVAVRSARARTGTYAHTGQAISRRSPSKSLRLGLLSQQAILEVYIKNDSEWLRRRAAGR